MSDWIILRHWDLVHPKKKSLLFTLMSFETHRKFFFLFFYKDFFRFMKLWLNWLLCIIFRLSFWRFRIFEIWIRYNREAKKNLFLVSAHKNLTICRVVIKLAIMYYFRSSFWRFWILKLGSVTIERQNISGFIKNILTCAPRWTLSFQRKQSWVNDRIFTLCWTNPLKS